MTGNVNAGQVRFECFRIVTPELRCTCPNWFSLQSFHQGKIGIAATKTKNDVICNSLLFIFRRRKSYLSRGDLVDMFVKNDAQAPL
jgi:hypothetical protein